MRKDELETSEIRRPGPGFDRRDRTVRGYCDKRTAPGEHALIPIPLVLQGRKCEILHSAPAGEELLQDDLVELENGMWWRAAP
jgi:hypothetical protein